MDLNVNLINQYYLDFQSKCTDYKKMKDYYDNKQDIDLTYSKKNDRGNFTSVRNYVAKFVNDETNFVCGVPVNYISSSNNDDVIKEIEYNLATWDKKHDINLTREVSIYGEATELYYIDGRGNFKAKILNPSNSYIVKNEFDEVEMLLYVFKRTVGNTSNNDDTYIDIYTKDFIYHYKNTISNNDKGFKIKDLVEDTWSEVTTPTINIFGEVPIGSDGIGTIFNKIKNAQDEYNLCSSEQINLVQDLRQFYLAFINLDPNDEKNKNMIQQINNKSIMFLNGDSDVKTIDKNINDTFMQNVRNNIKEDIYELVGHINMQKSPSSNTSGEQIINRMIQLKFRCSELGATLQNIIIERIRFLFIYRNIKKAKKYDYRDINVKITLNVPKDWTVMANVISQLSGSDVVSKETMRSMLPLDHSPAIEKQKVDREKEEELNSLDSLDETVIDTPQVNTNGQE